MTAFITMMVIVGGLIVVGLLVNVYLYSHGVFKRRRARRIARQEQDKRITTAGLDEQFYSSIGIGPTNPVE